MFSFSVQERLGNVMAPHLHALIGMLESSVVWVYFSLVFFGNPLNYVGIQK